MKSLRSLIDWLPYYFRDNDTYKKDGKGLFERYLEIFGNYFEDKVIGDINTLDDILDVDSTPEIYLGYIWEFLGSMPYANPNAIDPERWKILFNGFDSPTTIDALKKYWVYPMNVSANGTADHFDLTEAQVRALVKYSIALYSIRGTKKFFKVLLKLYGIEAEIYTSKAYPKITVEDGDDSDYYGTDGDYYGTDDDYFGSTDTLFDTLSEPTKLDSEWMDLDVNTLDKHSNCTHFVSVNFVLNLVNYAYSNGSNEFFRLQNRMFNLINMFLPLGVRPHIIWKGLYGISEYVVPKVNRSMEVYVDHTPIGWKVSDTNLVASSTYPGWYRVFSTPPNQGIPNRYFDTIADLHIMVKVVDTYIDTALTGKAPNFISDQPKRFKVDFEGNGIWSDKEYDDGYIFTIKAGSSTKAIYPKFKVSVIDEDDFNLTNGTISTFILAWKKKFNYNIFSWYNPSISLELDNTNNYIPILIQSASVKTYTNDADPKDDSFTPEPISLNDYDLVLVESNTTIPDRDGNPVSYSAYADLCIYVIHLFEPGTYKFYQKNNPDKILTIEVTRAGEVLTNSLVEGLANNMVDNENPTCSIRIEASSNLPKLKDIYTRPLYVDDNGGDIWDTLVVGSVSGIKLTYPYGNHNNTPYFKLSSMNLYKCNSNNRDLPVNITMAYLTKPVHDNSQYIRFIIREYTDEDHPTWYDKKIVTFYPVTGDITAEEEIYTQNVDSNDEFIYKYGRDVKGSGSDAIINQFSISNPVSNKGLGQNGSTIDCQDISIRSIGLLNGLASILSYPGSSSNKNTLQIMYRGLYDNDILIKEVTNPVTQIWNNGEEIILDDPGHYRFYGVSKLFHNVTSNKVDINIESNKYKEKYYLEVFDNDKSDDESYMLRTKISVPDNVLMDTVCNWGFNFTITLDKSIVEAKDILTVDPNAFDFEVLLYRGATPNTGFFIRSYTAYVEVFADSEGNTLPHYKVQGSIQLPWMYGNYILSTSEQNGNYPPGLYCIELHARNKVWPDSPTYKVVDAYAIPQKFEGNLYFDVDVISKAWTSPAGQIYDVDPITGKRTWGWYKTNPDFKHSVRLAQYNPAVDIPSFRLKLTNNDIGYTRVYMYKLVKDGKEWDKDPNVAYPKVLPPRIDNPDHTGIPNPHWLSEAKPEEWGFPGSYNSEAHGWIYEPTDYTGRWLFTGTVYTLGELIQGPQEPGQYLFMINQLDVDKKTINYAYLSVKEDIDYSLLVDPMLSILQGTAVGTTVTAISSAKFTKENLCVTVSNNQGVELDGKYELPYSFYAYQPGTYKFRLYKFESGAYIPITNRNGEHISANFKVLTSNGISDEYLNWTWSEVSEKVVQVVTTSEDINWTVKVQTE